MDGGYSAGFLADFITTSAPAVTWDVLYDGNGNDGGSVPVDPNSPYADGATVTVLGNTGSLVQTGFAWENWNTAANGSGTDYDTGETFAIGADVTLYAQWIATGPPVTGGAAAPKTKLFNMIYMEEEDG